MLALCVAGGLAFSAPTVQVKTPPVVARASPMHMMAGETSSRRAILSAASLLAIPFAAQAKPEDYVGGCAPFHARPTTLAFTVALHA